MSVLLVCANYRNLVIARSRYADLAHLISSVLPRLFIDPGLVRSDCKGNAGDEGVVFLMEENRWISQFHGFIYNWWCDSLASRGYFYFLVFVRDVFQVFLLFFFRFEICSSIKIWDILERY